jgi:hypothetical protein
MPDPQTNAQAIIEAVREGVDPYYVDADGSLFVATDRDGHKHVIDTEKYAPRPRRTTRAVTFTDPTHFAEYFAAHAGPRELDGVEVWGDEQAATFTGIIDAPSPDQPGWAGHRATLKLTTSTEWSAWSGASGQLMGQEGFAEFIEDRSADIVRPTGAEMLELAQSFQAHTKVTFESAQILADGRRALEYREDVEARAGAKGQIEIPGTFDLALRPFLGCDPYKVVARFRYRMGGGNLQIGFKLNRPEDVLRAAFGDVVERVAAGTGRTVWMGRP